MNIMDVPVADQLAIQHLVGRYAILLNTGQLDAYMRQFVDDLTFDETRLGGSIARGQAELRKVAAMAIEMLHIAQVTSPPVLESFDGDRARGIVPYQAMVRLRKTNAPWQVNAYYQDEYVKKGGRWLFQSRAIVPLLPLDPFPAVAELYS